MAHVGYLRNVDASEHFESFLISAVAAILGIRGFLHLTGYPTVGGDALHVAHMLWGGLLMAAALLLLIGFLGKQAKTLGAVVGGLGFGTFIDELGKFLTHDNDYFFEPTVALIYVIFVVMYVWMARVRLRPASPEERLANALEITLEAVRRDLDAHELVRARALLEQGPARDPVGAALAGALAELEPVVDPRPGPLRRLVALVRGAYGRAVRNPWFPRVVVGFFVAHSIGALVQTMVLVGALAALALVAIVTLVAVFLLIAGGRGRLDVWRGAAVAAVVLAGATAAGWLVWARLPSLTWFAWGELLFSVVPATLVLIGVFRMRASRLDAYRMFRRAVLLTIFVTQFFAFYHDQFAAAVGLIVNVVVLATLRYVIHEELLYRGEVE